MLLGQFARLCLFSQLVFLTNFFFQGACASASDNSDSNSNPNTSFLPLGSRELEVGNQGASRANSGKEGEEGLSKDSSEGSED